jgi:hypothetical protein
MFDQLIANIDRNQGNLLYDRDWHLVLIDHSRAVTDVLDMSKFRSTSSSTPGWQRIEGLTMDELQPDVGKWVSRGCSTPCSSAATG